VAGALGALGAAKLALGRLKSLYGALQHITPSRWMDGAGHDFKNDRATGVLEPDGDKAFDEETFTGAAPLPSLRSPTVSTVIQIMSKV
jgi:hypothetical protein